MREYCWKHQVLREAGAECVQCAAEAQRETRETIGVLLDRLAEQDAAIAILRRRVAGLERRLGEVQP